VKVLIDTSVWSLAFRRKESDLSKNEIIFLNELKELINEVRTIIIGPIRQEILSGIQNHNQFDQLKNKLSLFEDSIITTKDYELAADFYNICRKRGIQGSHIDFLISAFSVNNNYPIFTLDKDFNQYIKYCEIRLHKSRFAR